MIVVNGEQVWVPTRRSELIAGLRRMGISKVAGVPLSKLHQKDLLRAYCRERAAVVRRQQRERAAQHEERLAIGLQLKLFGVG